MTVQPGETLSDIAARHGLSLSRLMQLNGIRNADQVEAGRRLVLTAAAPAAQRPRAGATAATGTSTVVRSGETLSEIADRHGTTVARLLQLNRLPDPDHVQAGTRLVLPSSPAAARTRPATAAAPRYDRKAKEHVVRSGETLSQIASGYGLPVSRLVALNRLSDPDQVEAGTRLRLQGEAAPARPLPSRPPNRSRRPNPGGQHRRRPQATSRRHASGLRQASGLRHPNGVRQASVRRQATGIGHSSRHGHRRPAASAKPAQPDWRTYGPLQVDWANWQPMGGSFVTPSLNGEGQPLYLAINCSARRLNATGQSGQWKSWDPPQSEFEQQLISDLCKARAS